MLPLINIIPIRIIHIGRQSGSVVKNLPVNAGDMGSIPGSGRSLGEDLAAHPSLAWEMAWTEEPSGLLSMGS